MERANSDGQALSEGLRPNRVDLAGRAGIGLDGPRERLFRLGAERLTDHEILALLIRTGAGGGTSLELSAKVLAQCGSLERLTTFPALGLRSIGGIGPAKLASLMAAVEMGRRMATRPLRAGDSIKSPRDVYRHFYRRLRDHRQEHFMTLLLDGRHRVLRESQISLGTLTASLVHPREVFRPAITAAAAALVLAHNHPSGDPAPSAEDMRVTRRLVEAGEVIGIRVVDHVIVAEEGFYSFQENGKISE